MPTTSRVARPLVDLLRKSVEAPDPELLAKFVEVRDEAAFAALVERHGTMVFGVCRRMLGNTPDAEDAFQAVFFALARNARSVRRRAALAAWLYGAATRVCLKVRRGHARSRTKNEPIDRVSHEDPLAGMSAREFVTILEEEIARLPDRFRLPVVLCLVDGLSQQEAAERLGCSAGSVKGRLERGRERLRRRLTSRGVALGAALSAAAVTSARAVPPALFSHTVDVLNSAEVPARIASLARGALPSAAPRGWSAVVLLVGGVVIAAAAGGDKPAPDSPLPKAEAAASTKVDLFDDPLPPGAVARLGTVRFRTGMWMKQVAISPDGSKIVSFGHNFSQPESVDVWDVATGRSARHVALPPVNVERAFWLANGRGFAVTKVSQNDYTVWEFTDEKAAPPTPLRPNEMNAFGHGSFATSAISPDGKLIAGGQRHGVRGNEGKIQVWDLAPNGRVRAMTQRWEHDTAGAFVGLTFTPDGRSLVGVTQRREPDRPGNAAPGKPVPVVPGQMADDFDVVVWDAATGKESFAYKVPAGSGWTPAISPDSRLLYDARRDGRIAAYDLTTGKERSGFPAFAVDDGRNRPVGKLALTPDGKTLLLVQPFSQIAAFDAATGKELWRNADTNLTMVNSVAVSADSKRFVIGANDGSILVGDVATGRVLNEQPGHRGGIAAAALAADGTALTVGNDRTFRRWDLRSGKEVGRVAIESSGNLRPLRISPDGSRLLSAFNDGSKWSAALHDTASGKRIAELAIDDQKLLGLTLYAGKPAAWLPDGSVVMADGAQAAVRFDPDGREIRRYTVDADRRVTVVAASPDGRTIVLAGAGPGEMFGPRSAWVCAYDAATGRPGRVWECATWFKNAAFTPDGSAVVLTGDVGQPSRRLDQRPADVNPATAVMMFDPRRGEGFAPFDMRGDAVVFRGTTAIAISPHTRQVAVAERDDTITVFEAASGAIRFRLRGHRNQIEQLAFTADGSRLLSVSRDLTGLVWDVGPPAAKVALSDAERQARWELLLSSNAMVAHRAMGELAADPTAAVALLKANLKPTPKPTGEEIDKLIAKLDAASFAERDAAARELERLGTVAATLVRERLGSVRTAEVGRRLDDFLKRHDQPYRLTGVRLREARAKELLEMIGDHSP